MKNPTEILLRFSLVKYGFCQNSWVWFHILGGGVLARILSIWLPSDLSLIIVIGVALLWEGIEFVFETKGDPTTVYGSWGRWMWDSLGDIMGTIICALLILF